MTNQVNVVNRGFEYVAQWINIGSTANTTTWVKPSFIGWGGANGSNATSTVLPVGGPVGGAQGTGQWNDVGPFNEYAETRTSGTVSVTGNTAAAGTVTAQIVGTLTSLSNQSVGESFLTMSATKPYETTINGTLPTGNTSLTVNTVWPAVSVPFYLQNNNEVIQVSSTSSTTLANVIVRAQNGSTANAGATGQALSLGNIPGAGASNPNNGDMFAHAGFIALSLNTGDSIQFTWQVGVTS